MRNQESIVAKGLIKQFNEAGLIGLAAVHAARSLELLYNEKSEQVLLATALTVQATQLGSTCLPMDSVSGIRDLLIVTEEITDEERLNLLDDLDWPDFEQWRDALASSPVVSTDSKEAANQYPLRFVSGKLYLEKNWLAQDEICQNIISKISVTPPVVDQKKLSALLDKLFSPENASDKLKEALIDQRRAVENSVNNWLSVIAGGPGTGKTHTLASLLMALSVTSERPLRVGLTAFSGKAAARMNESLSENELTRQLANVRLDRGVTLHKLLGSRGPLNGFTYDAGNKLPHDVVIVDEVSMLSLPLMTRLLSALRADARLVLIGDPDQLTSIDVGTVLADIVEADMPGNRQTGSIVSRLHVNLRNEGQIPSFAAAIRDNDPDTALEILDSSDGIEYIEMDAGQFSLGRGEATSQDILAAATKMLTSAQTGDISSALEALDSHRVLCAHAHGAYGVSSWQENIEIFLRSSLPGWNPADGFHAGMPVLITSNSPDIEIYNGDTGVLVNQGSLQAAIGSHKDYKLIPTSMLDAFQLMHALTVHKSQGSQYEKITLILPPPESPILTRELLYTAATRAKRELRIIGTRESIISAAGKPARRASGLTEQLRLSQPGA